MSNHLKRLAAPKIWKITRKTYTFAPKASPGPHNSEMSVALLVVLRDILAIGDNRREIKKILSSRVVRVDGRVITDIKFPIGFMDVISVNNKNYRLMYDIHGNVRLVEISDEHAEWKLVRIENKTVVKGGKIVLNLHDGRNIIVDKNSYRTGDVLKLKVPTQEIVEYYPMQAGSVAVLTGGVHRGQLVHIKDYRVSRNSSDNMVLFEEGFGTVKRNVFVIGVGKPEVMIPEVSAI